MFRLLREKANQSVSNVTSQNNLFEEDWCLCSMDQTNLEQLNLIKVNLNEYYTNTIIKCISFELLTAPEAAFTNCTFEKLINLHLENHIARCFVRCKFPELHILTFTSTHPSPVFIACMFPHSFKYRIDEDVFLNCTLYPQTNLIHPLIIVDRYGSCTPTPPITPPNSPIDNSRLFEKIIDSIGKDPPETPPDSSESSESTESSEVIPPVPSQKPESSPVPSQNPGVIPPVSPESSESFEVNAPVSPQNPEVISPQNP